MWWGDVRYCFAMAILVIIIILSFCDIWSYILRFINRILWGNCFSSGKFFLSDCNETSQELSLGCVVVHLGFEIFKMAAGWKLKNNNCWSNCNETWI
jgi:hypothetical protein